MSVNSRSHPYIPNSAPQVRQEMLEVIGVGSVEDLYQEIPTELQLNRRLNIPEGLMSEYDLRRHVDGILAKNVTCNEYANFLGAGCYQHFIPAVCDEINSRGEFLTAYAGATYSDHGKHQAWFEFQSLLAELIDMDVVSFPTYDWSTAASSAILMALRLTDRGEAIVPKNLNPGKLSQMNVQVGPAATIKQVSFDPKTGQMDLEDLKRLISNETGAVYFENPSYLGVVETQGAQIADIAHAAGAMVVTGVDPITLGVLTPPSQYGADIVCGDAQTLGNHLLCGGGLCGFIASHEDARVMEQYPTMLESVGRTEREGELAFGWATNERTSYSKRDLTRDFTGTSTGLWAITAAVYMALMGPEGMREVGETMLQKGRYAIKALSGIKGVRLPMADSPIIREFVVNFDDSGKTVKDINKDLLSHHVFGGKDLSQEFPELGQSALYCVTEVTPKENINRLAAALQEVLR
jgi:glycine dehydrogenase subunit 1